MSIDKELIPLKKKLIKRKNELLKKLSVTKERERSTSDIDHGNEFDQAASVRDREMTFTFSSREREEIKAINKALSRMEDGTYGICEECGKPITLKRINILPFTPYCKDCQSDLEYQHNEIRMP